MTDEVSPVHFDPLPNRTELLIKAAQEAIDRLALLKPRLVPAIAELLQSCEVEHPKTVGTRYRKQASQLTDDQKRSLGIRTNAFMSQAALNDLTDKGMLDPIRAHETTLLRATFVLFRHRNAVSIAKMMQDHPQHPIKVQYEMIHPITCNHCNDLHGMPVPSSWGLFASQMCTCVTAPYSLKSEVDFLARYRTSDERLGNVTPARLLSNVRRFFVGRKG